MCLFGSSFVCFTAKKQSQNLSKNENYGALIDTRDSNDGNHYDMQLDQNTDGKQSDAGFGHENDVKPFVQAVSSRGNQENSAVLGATTIEIYDSDDDERQFELHTSADVDESQIRINGNSGATLKPSAPDNDRDDTQYDPAGSDSENEDKSFVKVESNSGNAIKTADIPFVQFNPNEVNDRIAAVNENSENADGQQTGSPSNRIKNKSKCIVGDKRFKCEHCDSFFCSNHNLEQHKAVHANGKLIGVKADSNGLFHCTLCVRRFINVCNLSAHLKSHKNNQRLHYCAQCLCGFEQKTEKDRHESQCKGRHFECHICKVFLTKDKNQLERHMRKHSGAAPFQCMVCGKNFRRIRNLRYYLNSIHSRN